jgi:hypothetical protein
VVGAIWAYLLPAFFGFFMILVIGFGVGWAVSESVSLATNRKRGLGLQISAVMGVALTFLVKEVLSPGNFVTDLDLIAAGVAAFFAASRLRIGG